MNDLHCDCGMAWMKEYNPLGMSSSEPLCTSPPLLAGRNIQTVSYEDLGCGKSLSTLHGVRRCVCASGGEESVYVCVCTRRKETWG